MTFNERLLLRVVQYEERTYAERRWPAMMVSRSMFAYQFVYRAPVGKCRLFRPYQVVIAGRLLSLLAAILE